MSEVIRVRIYGTEIAVQGDSPEQVLSAAEYADRKIHELADHAGSESIQTLWALAVLNLAAEVLELQDECKEIENLQEKSEKLAKLLDDNISTSDDI